ncbi:MAG: hypothetical protein NC453_28940 [Muribaculum sp.]|nr:hypothetical protein [Muribaculum sp.]
MIKEKKKQAASKNITAEERENLEWQTKQLEMSKKFSEIGWQIVMWIGIAILFLGLCWVVGIIWYYFCCGFMIIEEPNFFWKIIYGALSLVFLTIVLGGIAELFGWHPWRK